MNQYVISLLRSPSLQLTHLKQIHAFIITQCVHLAGVLCKSLLGLSRVDYAHQVFSRISEPDHILCNSLISGYSRMSFHKEAVHIFCLMHHSCSQIFRFNFASAISSCASLSARIEGEQIHSLVICCGLGTDTFINTAFLDLYAKVDDLCSSKRIFDEILVKDAVSYNSLMSAYWKSGLTRDARLLFDRMPERTVVSWNSMISCYAQHGDLTEVFKIFDQMQADKISPNEFTLAIILSMCAKLRDLKNGLKIRDFIEQNKLRRSLFVSTALLEMYVKCGAMEQARLVFDTMAERDTVTWSAMIAGYAQNCRASEALELFSQMKLQNIKPNDVALVSVLSACVQLGSVEAAERIGIHIESQGLDSSVHVCSALLDMYAKFGNIKKAYQVFNQMPDKDIVSWNSMIGGLARNGLAKEAICLFSEMIESSVRPNVVTFVVLLTACAHAGLVELGLEFFESMQSVYNIVPTVEHCACMVDLLCRSGRLQEACVFVCRHMQVAPNAVIWGTLLNASRMHSNKEVAICALKKLMLLEPDNSGNLVLLSNLYASVGKWEKAFEVRNLMKEHGVQKAAAYSWIEVNNVMNKFLVSDLTHPRSDEIFMVLGRLDLQLKCSVFCSNAESEFL